MSQSRGLQPQSPAGASRVERPGRGPAAFPEVIRRFSGGHHSDKRDKKRIKNVFFPSAHHSLELRDGFPQAPLSRISGRARLALEHRDFIICFPDLGSHSHHTSKNSRQTCESTALLESDGYNQRQPGLGLLSHSSAAPVLVWL